MFRPRCDPEMADLPKTATMPSIKEDTRSYLEDEVASQGSGGKASREDSLVSGKGGRLRNMVHFTMKKKEEEGGRGEVPPGPTPLPPPYSEAVKQEEEGGGPGKILRKITTKSAKKKEKEDVVEFKLVEDLRLVTIPITSCLMVLISYIVFGAVLFSTWEVRRRQHGHNLSLVTSCLQGWNYLDGAYFCFISLMTIGFGDFVPGNSYIYNVAEHVTEQVSTH